MVACSRTPAASFLALSAKGRILRCLKSFIHGIHGCSHSREDIRHLGYFPPHTIVPACRVNGVVRPGPTGGGMAAGRKRGSRKGDRTGEGRYLEEVFGWLAPKRRAHPASIFTRLIPALPSAWSPSVPPARMFRVVLRWQGRGIVHDGVSAKSAGRSLGVAKGAPHRRVIVEEKMEETPCFVF